MGLGRMIAPMVTGGLLASPSLAGHLTLELTLPEIATATYYRPYLAAWIEVADGSASVATLAVWYDTRIRDDLGKGWLKNLRSWWRTTGETMALPADGISGPTRGAGTHLIVLDSADGPLSTLPPGRYQLAVEVVREDGGRDLVRLPLDWTGVAATVEGTGTAELGALRLTVAP